MTTHVTVPTPFAAAKAKLIAELAAHGVTQLDVTYDGEGDSGQIQEVNAYAAPRDDPDRALLTVPLERTPPLSYVDEDGHIHTHPHLHDFVESLAWQVIEHFHAGFENNSGGYGVISLDVRDGVLRLTHNDAIVDYVTTNAEV